MYGYIYKTTNLVNNKIYVGQHQADKFDPKYYGSGVLIKQAIKKYGICNFICEMLECCETKRQLEEREIYWIDKCGSCNSGIGYNLSYGGYTPRFRGENHPMYGRHHSEEAKEKNRLSKLGKKQSSETINKRNETLKAINAKKKQDKTSRWIAERHKCAYCGAVMLSKYGSGKFCSAECVHKYVANIHRGTKASPETIEKQRQSHLGNAGYWSGKVRDVETCRKISDSLAGKPNHARRIKFTVGSKFFNGLDEGATFFGITKSCMSLWVKQGHTNDGQPIKKI